MRKVLLLSALLFIGLCSFSQMTISGMTCVNAGPTYTYSVSSSYTSGYSTIWQVSGGVIAGTSNTSQSGINLYQISVVWSSGSSKNVGCHVYSPSAPSGNLNVSVAAALVPGSITSNATQTIYHTTPGAINCSVATGGGCGTITYAYQWQQSTDAVNWTSVSGSTGQNLSFSTGPSQTTYYRRMVNASGTIGYSGNATVYVLPNLNGGTSSPANQNIFTGASPTAITVSAATGGNCSSSYTYQWVISTNGGTTYNLISGATGTSYTPPSPTQTSYYERMVYCASEQAYSSPAIIAVYQHVSAGTISPASASVNYNYSPGTLTAAAATGGMCSGAYGYQWQQSTDGTTYSDISGATGLTYTPGTLTANTFFRQKITCSPETVYTTNPVLVTVYPQLVPGSVSPSSQNINYISTPATLSSSGVSGGNGSYSYQWSSSPDNTNWNPVTGATSSTYNPGNLSSSVYYRVAVTSNTISLNSSSAFVNVYPQLQAGTISPNSQTINYNGSPSTLSLSGTSGGNGSYSYQWYSGPLGGNWTLISGATGTSYTPVSLSSTLYYLCVVTSNGVPANSNTPVVNVYPQLVPGTVSPASASINYNSPPGQLSSTGVSGGSGSYTYQWYSSPDNTNWNLINTAVNATYTPGNLTATTYYRVAVNSNGVVLNSSSSAITVYPQLNAGSISPASQTINYNRIPGQLSITGVSGGNGSYNYQWYSSADNSTWSPILNATGTTYSVGNLTSSAYYYAAVASNGVTLNSSSAAINVNPQVLPGIITPAYIPITSGTSPGELTSSAASGGACGGVYNYQWQASSDGVNFSNVTGATSQNYIPGNLSANTWYRRIAICGTDSEYSNISRVAIVSGTTDMNYVRVRSILKAGVTDSATAYNLTSTFDVNQTTQYFDGLGRSVQTVAMQQSPMQNDMVSTNVYDAFGREANKYLPYTASTNDGNYKMTALADGYNFNSIQYSGEQYYYGQVNFEPSPLNRVLSSMAPGMSWTGTGRGTANQYLINTTNDSVRIWIISSAQGSIPTSTGTYTAGTLYKNVTIDENNNNVIEYKDMEGHTVLKKVQLSPTPGTAHVGWLCTYYVYDTLENMRFVVQPQAVALINSTWTITSGIANELCFRYEYDQRKHMIIKKIPGAGEVWMVYDSRNRLVMTQDSVMRSIKKWMFTSYDSQNRSDSTGLITDNSNYNMLSYHLTNAYGSSNYPLVSSYPNELLTQTFYDDYAWVAGATPSLGNTIASFNTANFITSYNSSPVYAVQVTPHYITRGMVTGSMTKVIGTSSQYLYGVSFYDDRGRVIQSQSINYTGAVDTVTIQYDFSSKPLRNLLSHKKAGNTIQNHTIATKMDYDQGFRLKHIYKNIDNSITDQLIDSMQYNELGQLKAKYLGNNIDSLVYDYNIRGWLTGINKNYVGGTTNHYFGMELGYDKQSSVSTTTYAASQYNGNITGTVWKSAGDAVGRKYDFTYDPVNRLTAANFVQNTSGSAWDASYINYSVGNLSYDANGNIISMSQYGFKVGGSSLIDQLSYTYQVNSNKLSQVNDASNDANSKLGDFHYTGTKAAYDYTYDGNGNLQIDNNKGIDNINYNYLNLPQLVHLNGKGNIVYTYDAGGNKLSKVTTDTTNRHVTTTLYMGTLVYQQTDTITNPTGGVDTLQFIAHEEGRVRWAYHKYLNGSKVYGFEYDFFEKDHLGNTRMVLTQQKDTAQYLASMEAAYRATENQLFGNIASTSYSRAMANGYPVDTTVTNPNDSVSRVNGNPAAGQKMGPNLLLKVMSGDKIDIGVNYYYNTGTTSTPNSYVNDVLNSMATGIVSLTGGAHGSLSDLTNTGSSPVYAALNSFVTSNDATPSGKPKAYLNWILLDDQFKYVSSYPQSGALPVGAAGLNGSGLQPPLAYSGIPITKNGYLYIWVSNETPNWDVFFDNLSVKQYSGPLLEENHYYPFGLTMAGISDKAIKTNYAENKYRYNKGSELQNKEFSDGSGLEMYATNLRQLDPQLGRWWQLDSKPDYAQSLYASMNNNPIQFNDPLGDEGNSTHIDSKGNVLKVYNDGDNGVYVHTKFNTAKKVEEHYSEKNTSAGGKKIGETWTPLGFANFEVYQKSGKIEPAIGAKIDIGSTWATDKVSKIVGSWPDPFTYGLNAKKGGDWDIKAHVPDGETNAYGSLLFGKYASARDAGNMAAGGVSQLSVLPNALYDYGFGAYNQSGNSILGTIGKVFGDIIQMQSNPQAASVNINNTIINGEDKLSKQGIDAGRAMVKKLITQ